MTRYRRLTRVGADLLWGVVMLTVLAATVLGGMLGGTALGYGLLPRYNGGHEIPWLLGVGACVGVVTGVVVCHRARGWVQRARMRMMRHRAVDAIADVVWCDYHYQVGTKGPGSSRYTVYLSWRDPDGQHTGERRYRFIGRGRDDFAHLVRRGGKVPIRYPAGRPHRFVIDIPFAPTMADQFL
ncbi:hypothetical protein [Krasilnikovia sp. MM14-A1004]|uniref:hypothetical protein n=1 Tax=Krasilnikovia sp. MM14-A1004 TaxID=3373541 RepID=UPI00399C682D